MAISLGSRLISTRSKSMTTDVSTSPRSGRTSATRSRLLIDDGVDVAAEPLAGDRRRTGEDRLDGFGGDKRTLADRDQFTDRDAVARDDEGIALVEGPHDPAAVVAQLALGDLPAHLAT